ncbi:TPA: hypothetical protein M2P25_002750 [Klebsiella quasipneumoniae]|nr:hypothetical protein [Klebsiella quasipneumoniae]
MMKYVVLLALTLFTSLSGWAFSLDNADIQLLCPQRGQIKVLLHRYQHTQQSWGDHHFETGGGYMRQGPLLVIPFANLDQMIYHQTTGEFAYWYAEAEQLVRCRLLSLATLYPVDIPYYRE